MKIKYLFGTLALVALMASCSQQPNREESLKEISTADSTFTSNANKMAINPAEASHRISPYTQFVDRFPSDSLAPIFLLKAGDIAAHTANTDTAIMLYDRAISDYAAFPHIDEAYFCKAWTLESAERYAEAKEAFEIFVEKYPAHPLANDIRLQLKNNLIGLSPEEQLNAILSQNE